MYLYTVAKNNTFYMLVVLYLDMVAENNVAHTLLERAVKLLIHTPAADQFYM